MKLNYILATFAALVMCACTDYQTQIDSLRSQIEELSSASASLSAQASSLEEVLAALKNDAEAASFSPISAGGSVAGYSVTFKDGGKLTLYNQPCNVTIEKDGADYYWKADGEWLTYSDGARIKVAPDSSVPQFKIEGSILKVSFDNGATYSEVGETGERYVESISDAEDAVTITLAGGRTITIPKSADAAGMRVAVDLENLPVRAGASTTIRYTVENATDNTKLFAVADGGWKAEVMAVSAAEGSIRFTAPEDGCTANVTLMLSDNSGATYMQAVTFDVIPQVEPYEICAYHVLQKERINPLNFKKMAEAGVNVAHSYKHQNGDFAKAAAASAGSGVKLVGELQDYVYNYTTMSDEDYKVFINSCKQLEEDIAVYRQAENLWGYSLIDEPRDSLFVKIGYLSDRIRQIDPDHKLYVNLWGDQMCDDSLIPFVNDAHPDFISFDQYPTTYSGVNGWWWERLENVYRISRQYNVPWWGFAASTDVGNYDFGNGCCIPSEASIKLQMYGNILYGAEALEYFTWELYPGGRPGLPDQHYAPVTNTGIGEYMDTYDYVCIVDKEINARKFIFDGADIKWIRHTKNNVPSGCISIKNSDDPIMPGCIDYYAFPSQSHCMLELLENHGHEFLVIFNKEHTSKARVTMELTKALTMVDNAGCFVPFELEDDAYYIEPGGALILMIE